MPEIPDNSVPTQNESHTRDPAATDGPVSVQTDHGKAVRASSALVGRPLPAMFGRYRIERELGSGAMGQVFLAEDTQLGRKVALKIPHEDLVCDGHALERFYREARAAATLRHANLCPVFDVGAIESVHFLAMAYIAGKPLSAHVSKETPVPDQQAALWIYKLADAIETAHRSGVIHRDLKPSNVMLDECDEPIVLDFGLARIDRASDADVRLTKTGMVFGTPAYMSPEQVAGDQGAIGPASDIYSLGVMLYELLTGELPFSGSVSSVFKQILADAPRAPSALRPRLDRRLEAICLKMMAKDIQERYSTMRDAADALAVWLSKTPSRNGLGGMRATPRIEGEKHSRGRRLRLAAAFLALGVSLVAIPLLVIPALPELGMHLNRARNDDAAAPQLAGDVRKTPDRSNSAELISEVPPAALSPAENLIVDTMPDSEPELDPVEASPEPVEESLDLQKPEAQTTEPEPQTTESAATPVSPAPPDEDEVPAEPPPQATVPPIAPSKGTEEVAVATPRESSSGESTKDSAVPKPRKSGSSEVAKSAPPLAIAPFSASHAKAHQRAWAKYLKTEVEIQNQLGMTLVLIPPGEFTMGSDENADELVDLWDADIVKKYGRDVVRRKIDAQKPAHRVRLTKPFFLSKYEVTKGEFRKFVEDTGHQTDAERDGKGGKGWDEKTKRLSQRTEYNWRSWGTNQSENSPVVNVSWDDALAFCKWLSREEGETCWLPTEAEWEYACRAGTTGRFYNSDDWESVVEIGNVRDASFTAKFGLETTIKRNDGFAFTCRRGEFTPNAFGLFDMHGNVSEWCADWCSPYNPRASHVTDPFGNSPSSLGKVVRGGGWLSTPVTAHAACRIFLPPTSCQFDLGFRIARAATGPTE